MESCWERTPRSGLEQPTEATTAWFGVERNVLEPVDEHHQWIVGDVYPA